MFLSVETRIGRSPAITMEISGACAAHGFAYRLAA
jgi:hypothetical protein